jgi:DNA modification methylase
VSGLTHRHYKYPARFSPSFARAAIESFSSHGQVVLDPFMGGGTTIVEALAANRVSVGCDLNSLAAFVTKVKTTPLSRREQACISAWTELAATQISYRDELDIAFSLTDQVKNLDDPQSRVIRKYLGLCIQAADSLPTKASKEFARCTLLNVGQWAIHGRRHATTLASLRSRVASVAKEMLAANSELRNTKSHSEKWAKPTLIHGSAEQISKHRIWDRIGKADLVVTSPPYPGVHVLYHRWQVNGRRETSAPYWIANRLDGQGGAYYNFGERRRPGNHDYFENLARCLRGIRSVMKDGAFFVQLVAFSRPDSHLPAFLECMQEAGFTEPSDSAEQRAWRNVPGRSWHAQLKGKTNGASEVALIHRAS